MDDLAGRAAARNAAIAGLALDRNLPLRTTLAEQLRAMQSDSAERRCAFCGGGPLTKEHVFRSALRGLVGDTGPHRRIDYSTGQIRELPFDLFDQTVRRVCASCNNGWMNDLEIEVEPIIQGLVAGSLPALSRAESRLLARWAAKTTLMRMFAEVSGPILVDDADCHFVWATDAAPFAWTVWLAVGSELGLEDALDHHKLNYIYADRAMEAPRRRPSGFASVLYTVRYGAMSLMIYATWGDPAVVRMIRRPLVDGFRARLLPISQIAPFPRPNCTLPQQPLSRFSVVQAHRRHIELRDTLWKALGILPGPGIRVPSRETAWTSTSATEIPPEPYSWIP